MMVQPRLQLVRNLFREAGNIPRKLIAHNLEMKVVHVDFLIANGVESLDDLVLRTLAVNLRLRPVENILDLVLWEHHHRPGKERGDGMGDAFLGELEDGTQRQRKER